jgi:hypothetical protein
LVTTVRFDASGTDDGRKQMVTAHLTVTKDGAELAKMYPARWYFRKHEDQPTTEVAIRRSFSEDVYIVLAQFEPGTQSATVELVVTPLVNFVWFGFGILGLGTLIALLPDSLFAFAVECAHACTATAPAGAAWPASPSTLSLPERAARLARRSSWGVGRALVCCAGPAAASWRECECGYAAQMRDGSRCSRVRAKQGNSASRRSRAGTLSRAVDELQPPGVDASIHARRCWSRDDRVDGSPMVSSGGGSPCRRRDPDRSGSRCPPGR